MNEGQEFDFKPLAPKEERPLQMPLNVNERLHGVVIGEKLIHLTKTEYQILWLLNSRNGELVTESEMVQFIWGDDEDKDIPLSNNVNAHLKGIRKKLGDPQISKVEIINEHGSGWRLQRIN